MPGGLKDGLKWLGSLFPDVRSLLDARRIMLGGQSADRGGYVTKGLGFFAGANPYDVDERTSRILKFKN